MNLRTDLIRIDYLLHTTCNQNLIAKDTLVRTAGVGEKNWDDEGAVAGCSMLVRGVDRVD
jgi:hypothetical protein